MTTTSHTQPTPTTRVEVITTHDPDGERTVTVFLDGVDITGTTAVVIEDIDPRDAENLEAWQSRTEQIRDDETYSPAFRDALASARTQCDGSDYLDGAEQVTYEVAYEIHSEQDRRKTVVASGSVEVEARSEAGAERAARTWVEENHAYFDPRIDPVFTAVDVAEL